MKALTSNPAANSFHRPTDLMNLVDTGIIPGHSIFVALDLLPVGTSCSLKPSNLLSRHLVIQGRIEHLCHRL